MVVMDKEDYINKAKELLGQQVYKKLDKDPTHRIKAKLITKLRTIKKETKLVEGTYKNHVSHQLCYPQVLWIT